MSTILKPNVEEVEMIEVKSEHTFNVFENCCIELIMIRHDCTGK